MITRLLLRSPAKQPVRALAWLRALLCVVATLLTLCACTTMRPVTAKPAELQQQIRSGALIAVGDQVSVFTQDHQEYELRITDIDADYLSGGTIRIPIGSITGLKTREFSAGKTASVTAGVTGFAVAGLFFVALSSLAFMP